MRAQLLRASCCFRNHRHVSTLAPPSLANFAIDAYSPLGVGAHATVYWARDRSLDQDVAIKVMSPALADANRVTDISQCIKKEVSVFDQLLESGKIHPNVVDLKSHFVSPGDAAKRIGFFLPTEAFKVPVHFFVTEFLGGGSLEVALKHKKASGSQFGAQEVLDVALSVSEGLRFLHVHGIAHRDVKPANLIYNISRTELKLIDFSLAGVVPKDEAHRFHGNVGTKGFVAPEVLRGNVEGYGPSCDIFSLGCVLHEMLAGEPPIVELTDESAKVTTCLPQKLSRATRQFVKSLLAPDPKDRPAANHIFNVCTALNARWEGRCRSSISSLTEPDLDFHV